MAIEILDMPQNSPEWLIARMAIPTASEFSTILASGRGGGESKTRATYMRKLAGERITGEPMESFTNPYLERGHAMEDEARQYYSFMKDVEPTKVGFIRNGAKGYSPDSLIRGDGLLEIKTQAPHLLIDTLLKGEFPPEHKAQCQGGLLVAERDWIDICVYWPKMPPFIQRAYRDPAYIVTLSKAIDQFNDELNDLVEKIRSYRR